MPNSPHVNFQIAVLSSADVAWPENLEAKISYSKNIHFYNNIYEKR